MSDNYTAVIIDDETLSREITKKYLGDHKEISVSAECSNGFDAIKKINELTPDLIFLDIQMPKLNGFEMLELLENPPSLFLLLPLTSSHLKPLKPMPRIISSSPIPAKDLMRQFKKPVSNCAIKPHKQVSLKN